MGAFMMIYGTFKIRGGVQNFVHSQLGNIPAWSPHDWGREYLQAVPYLEIVVGAMLVFGFLGRLAGLVGALMMITFTIGVTGWQPKGTPFTPNFIYLGVFLMIFLVGPGRFSVDGALFKTKSKSNFHPKD